MNPELVVKLVEDFEAEVNNGGFDQFFFNSTGDFSIETLEALELIKANKTAAILREACNRFPSGIPPSDRTVRANLMSATVSPNSSEFDSLDERFYAYDEDPGTHLEEFRKERGI